MSGIKSESTIGSSYAINALPDRPLPPTSLEEKAKQTRAVLSAVELLAGVHALGGAIAACEVRQLRAALGFAAGETSTARAEANDPSAHREITAALELDYEANQQKADRLLGALEHHAAGEGSSSGVVKPPPRRTTFGAHWRRLGNLVMEMLVVSTCNFFLAGSISLLGAGLLLYCRYTAPLMGMYIVWIFTKGRPKFPVKRNMTFARLGIWAYYRDYFPTRCVVPKAVRAAFHPEKNYIFLYHPHGVLSFGALLNFALDVNHTSEALPGVRIHLQTLKFNFFIPFFRQVLLLLGCGDASARAIRHTLRAGTGESVLLVLGGSEEAGLSRPRTNDLVLKKRKGFVKIALQEGAGLVPVYGFGENDVYEHAKLADHPLVVRGVSAVKHLTGITIPLLKGAMPGIGFMPLRKPIIVVVGHPVELPKIENPTDAEIDFWRARYIDALQTLYEEYRGVYDLERTGLRIVK
ncbi:unnamed protein product [Phytomonas sp. Hart1]|nr:unnamed protein product [Phytomonas sp. Hart1]|eukprot:CCW70963.1 unnamed protein product [Phytomonas sp. isolate Hart1]